MGVAQSLGRATGDIWFDCYDVEGYLKEKGIIPISKSPRWMELPLHPGSQNIASRPLWSTQYQSPSVETSLLRATTNELVDEKILIGCKALRPDV